MRDDAFLRLVDLAYAAAVEPLLWQQFTEIAIEATAGDGGIFFVVESEDSEMSRMLSGFRVFSPDETVSSYLGGPVEIDPQMDRVASSVKSEIYLDVDHVDLDLPCTREYLDWQQRVCGTRHHMTATAILTPSLRAGVSIHNAAETGPSSPSQQASLRRIFPHLTSALSLAFRNSHLLTEAWWEGLQARHTGAAALLDDRGQIIRLSDGAERIVRRSDGITAVCGRLTAVKSDENTMLQATIDQAVRHGAARGGGLRITRTSGGLPWYLIAYPVARRARFLVPHDPAAIIHIIDPACRCETITEPQRRLFGFTARETEVANHLLNGHSLESLAAALGISRNTARLHLASLLRKTETNRQVDLVRLLSGLS